MVTSNTPTMSGSELDSFHRQILQSFSQEYDGDDDNWESAIAETADAIDVEEEEAESVVTAQQESQWRQLHAFLETDCEHSGQFSLSSVEQEVVEVFTQSYSMWDDAEPPVEWISAETGLSKTHTNRILSRLYGLLLTAIETTTVDEIYACIPSKYVETGLDITDTGTYATTSFEAYLEHTEEQENEREQMVVITISDEDVAPKNLTQDSSEPENSDDEDEAPSENIITDEPTEYIIIDEVPSESIRPYMW